MYNYFRILWGICYLFHLHIFSNLFYRIFFFILFSFFCNSLGSTSNSFFILSLTFRLNPSLIFYIYPFIFLKKNILKRCFNFLIYFIHKQNVVIFISYIWVIIMRGILCDCIGIPKVCFNVVVMKRCNCCYFDLLIKGKMD